MQTGSLLIVPIPYIDRATFKDTLAAYESNPQWTKAFASQGIVVLHKRSRRSSQ
jgi:hypothetical protein